MLGGTGTGGFWGGFGGDISGMKVYIMLWSNTLRGEHGASLRGWAAAVVEAQRFWERVSEGYRCFVGM